MEWIGFYYEWQVGELLAQHLGGARGPKYGRTEFDYQNVFVWDTKGHPETDKDGKINDNLVLNDQEAILSCMQDHGGIGFIVVCGDAQYDTDGSFKIWHDELKGEKSRYVAKNIARGAPNRMRKSSFEATHVDFFFLSGRDDIARGVKDGWIRDFQKNMRNSNGLPRRAKFQIIPSKVPSSVRPMERLNLTLD